MKNETSWLTPSQAAAIVGCTARSIQNYIQNGKLSATREDGKYYIDKSEFYRVFPDAHKKEEASKHANKDVEIARAQAEMEVKYLKDAVLDKDRQNQYLKDQLESYAQEKMKMLDAIGAHARYLEHKDPSADTIKVPSERPKNKKPWWYIFKP